jgi:hypothetical protein
MIPNENLGFDVPARELMICAATIGDPAIAYLIIRQDSMEGGIATRMTRQQIGMIQPAGLSFFILQSLGLDIGKLMHPPQEMNPDMCHVQFENSLIPTYPHLRELYQLQDRPIKDWEEFWKLQEATWEHQHFLFFKQFTNPK